jgi:uncharacterized membrane protein
VSEQRDTQREVLRGASPRHRDEWGIEFARIVAFSDGVFAIAITLLVLQIDIPQNLPPGKTLLEELWAQRADIIAYAISFAVLGKLWLLHHRFFSALERFDATLMGLNLLYLAFIAIIPFTSDLLGDHDRDSTAVIAYAISMVGVTLTFHFQLVYAARNDLVRPELQEVERVYARPTNLAVCAVFLASIPVALISPLAATLMWPLVLFFAGQRLGDRVVTIRRR